MSHARDGLPRTRATDAFERRVSAALDAAVEAARCGSQALDVRGFDPCDAPLVVACSGGPDSTAALVAVTRARGRRASDDPSSRVHAACFDHGLRPPGEVAADQEHVRRLAECLGAGYIEGTGRAEPGRRSEAAAREARYRWLAEACRELGAQACVTGHQLDDQAETVLLRLARGAGLPGAAAMLAAASWPVPLSEGLRPALLRPLLGIGRDEIEGYLDALGIEARIDGTNDDLAIARNRVRQRVLPELRALNPRVAPALARFAELARRDDEALQAWADRELEALLLEGSDARDGGECELALDRARLRELPSAVATRVLRSALQRLGLSAEAGQLDTLLRLVGRRGAQASIAGGQAVILAQSVLLRREAPTG